MRCHNICIKAVSRIQAGTRFYFGALWLHLKTVLVGTVNLEARHE